MIRVLILLIAISTAHTAYATDLVEGQWEGKITMYKEKPAKASFRVRAKASGEDIRYKIEMFHNERRYKFGNLKVDGKSLKFTLDTGDEYECLLSSDPEVKEAVCKDKEGYCGMCTHQADGDLRTIIVNMLPPETAGDSPPETTLAAEPDEAGARVGNND
jgi:hypothetical protein